MKKSYVILSLSAATLAAFAISQIKVNQPQKLAKDTNKVAYVAGAKEKEQGHHDHDEDIEAEQIVVKITDEGYVTSHGDHFHYYNGKVPFDAIISEELLMQDPNYQLDPSHIVNQVKNGYIIKVDGKYYLYLTDKNVRDQVRTKEQVEEQKKLAAQDHKGQQAGASATSQAASAGPASGYKTDDGYVFTVGSILQDTGDGYIVSHGNHMHFIPKSQLNSQELAAAEVFMRARRGGTDLASPLEQPHNLSQPSLENRPSNPAASLNHSPLISQPDAGQPGKKQDQPDQKDWKVLLAQLEKMPKKDRYHEGDGLVFDPRQIVKRTELGVVIPHGDHYHFIAYKNLSALEEKIARLIPIKGEAHEDQLRPDKHGQDEHDHDHDGHDHDDHDHDGHDHDDHDEDGDSHEHDHAFDAHHVLAEDADGFMVGHGNHAHYFFKKDLTEEQIKAAQEELAKKKGQENKETGNYDAFSRDASDQEKMDYISKTYGVPLEAIKISEGYFVFNNPDQAYDPTHIHPYAVRKEHVRIPLVTGNDELDFLNELYATALRSGLSPYSIAVENGSFVIPHGDHNHYIKVQSKGMAAGLKNRLARIESQYQPGDLDKDLVKEKVAQVLNQAKKKYEKEPLKLRRIEMALGAFLEGIDQLASNSTTGYLTALDRFKDREMEGKKLAADPILSQVDKDYQTLIDRLALVDVDTYGYKKEEILSRLQTAKLSQDPVAMAEVGKLLSAIEEYRDRKGIVAVDYLKVFYLAAENDQVPEKERAEAADLALKLYRSQASLESVDLEALFPRLYELKGKLAAYGKTQKVQASKLDQEELNGRSYKAKIHEFVTGILGDFADKPKEKLDEQKLAASLAELKELLPKLKKSSFKDQVKAEFSELEMQPEKDADSLSQALYLIDKVKNQLEIEAGDEEPLDLETYQRLYNQLMSLHAYLEDKNAADEDFDRLDAYFPRLTDPSEDKGALEQEIKNLIAELKAKLESPAQPTAAEVSKNPLQPDSPSSLEPVSLKEEEVAAPETAEEAAVPETEEAPAAESGLAQKLALIAQRYGVAESMIQLDASQKLASFVTKDGQQIKLDLDSLQEITD